MNARSAMKVVRPPGASSIVAIAAHPDDIERWCAGTLALAAAAGATVRLVLVTSGDKGTSEPGAAPEQAARVREAEAREAARILGLSDVAFLRYPDGEVENSRELRRDLVAWIRRWRPDVLFTHDPEHPWPPYLFHRDHRATGRAALDAVYPLARDVLTFPELAATGLAPHVVREVWLFAGTSVDAAVDISSMFERKLAARLAHRSQTPDPIALRERWRALDAEAGAAAGLALAETFAIVSAG